MAEQYLERNHVHELLRGAVSQLLTERCVISRFGFGFVLASCARRLSLSLFPPLNRSLYVDL